MLKVLLLSFVISLSSFAFGARVITESSLIEMARKKAPTLDAIKASMLLAQNQKNLTEEQYAPELFGKGSYAETQEKPIIEFIPVFSPVKQAQLGVRQKFVKGLEAEAALSTNQQSASSSLSGTYDNVTVSILSFTMQMDLWRDLFGRFSEAQRDNARLEAKKAKIEEDVRIRAFEISLRKIYWSMVANAEQLKIAERLYVTAGHQLDDARKRYRNSMGDEGEVARYEAQVASRKGQVIFLTYQKEALIQQLKALLPDLGYETVELEKYNLDTTLNEVLSCSQTIMRNAQVPYDYTYYDEMVKLFRDIKAGQKIVNERYSDIDLKLFGTVKTTGVGSDKLGTANYEGSYADSFDDMTSNNRSGYEAGVKFTMPLGEAKKTTRDTLILYDNKRLQAAMDEADAKVVSTHTQLAKSLLLLKDVIETQTKNKDALERRLAAVRKKYAQARISVSDLILDQNALYLSEITTVDAKLQVLNVLLDYLMIFTETPCPFNRT